MERIDAHQHFWRYSPATHGWIDERMNILKRDFLPADLKPSLDFCHIDGCVAVQAESSTNETRWLLHLSEENPWIRGVVGWVDLCSPNVATDLRELSQNAKFKGVRHIVQSEPDDRFLLRPDFCRGISTLAEFGLTYDILIYPKQLPAALEFVSRFPLQKFMIDHLAKPAIGLDSSQPWERQMSAMAKFPNVYCKISGLVTETTWDRWKASDFDYYINTIYQTFGPERMVFGSDWPVCTLAASYPAVHGIVDFFFLSRPDAERSLVFGGNASRFYELS
ncbi:MAG: amidohydrolase family protein [Planctomycetota bacterium]